MYRYEHGITPKEFGFLVSADASTVRAWESGKNTPQKNRIRCIEEILSINKEELSTLKYDKVLLIK